MTKTMIVFRAPGPTTQPPPTRPVVHSNLTQPGPDATTRTPRVVCIHFYTWVLVVLFRGLSETHNFNWTRESNYKFALTNY